MAARSAADARALAAVRSAALRLLRQPAAAPVPGGQPGDPDRARPLRRRRADLHVAHGRPAVPQGLGRRQRSRRQLAGQPASTSIWSRCAIRRPASCGTRRPGSASGSPTATRSCSTSISSSASTATSAIPGSRPIVENGYLSAHSISTDLFQPWQLTAGGALRLERDLLVTFDVTYARWSEFPLPAANLTLGLDIGVYNDRVMLPAPRSYPPSRLSRHRHPARGRRVARLAADQARRSTCAAATPTSRRRCPSRSARATSPTATSTPSRSAPGSSCRRITAILPRPLALDVHFAATYLPARANRKVDPARPRRRLRRRRCDPAARPHAAESLLTDALIGMRSLASRCVLRCWLAGCGVDRRCGRRRVASAGLGLGPFTPLAPDPSLENINPPFVLADNTPISTIPGSSTGAISWRCG